MSGLDELRKQRAVLDSQIKSLEQKSLSRKGVLKQGEWCLITCNEWDDNPLVIYGSDYGPVCINGYLDLDGSYLVSFEKLSPQWEKWKAKKVSKEEAVKFL